MYERPQPTAAEKILLADREPLSRAEVESMFDEINLLVLEGDAAALAAKVAELSAVRHRSGIAVDTATVSGPGGRARTVVDVDAPQGSAPHQSPLLRTRDS